MADADEDAIIHHAPTQDPSQPETDLSDETQDFRFLSYLTDNTQPSLPRRGEKDFEPNPTIYQADVLSASRQAMHNALAYPRLHNPKNKNVGIYAPEGPAPPPAAAQVVSGQSRGVDAASPTLTKTLRTTGAPDEALKGVSSDACVYVPSPRGQYFRTMGQADRWNRVWLLPEEALYLLERGSLEIWWPLPFLTGCADSRNSEEDAADVEDQEMGIPMSLQAAYACFIGRAGLTIERFSVFTGLKRLGYTLVRAPSWGESSHETETVTQEESEATQLQKPYPRHLTEIFARLFQWPRPPDRKEIATVPVVGLGIHRSYIDVYRKLALIPWYDPVTVTQPAENTAAPFRIAFHVYKPSTAFRKSAPPPPDFRLAVVNARMETTIPTLAQVGALLECTPLDPPKGEKMERLLYMRLRHGYRNVIFGVVDQGVVSYLRFADAAFGKEKLYEEKGVPRSNKQKGFS